MLLRIQAFCCFILWAAMILVLAAFILPMAWLFGWEKNDPDNPYERRH